jgi:hypothetical protein
LPTFWLMNSVSLTEEIVPPIVVPDDETAAETAGMALPSGVAVTDGVIWAMVPSSIRIVLDNATDPTGPAGVPLAPTTRLVVVGLGAACATGAGAGLDDGGVAAGETAWLRVWLNPRPPSPEVDVEVGAENVRLGAELNTEVGRAVVEKVNGDELRRDPPEKPEKLLPPKVSADAGAAETLTLVNATPATTNDPSAY